MEIIEPTLINHRAMCENHRAVESTFLDNLQGRESLAETHLGVPKH